MSQLPPQQDAGKIVALLVMPQPLPRNFQSDEPRLAVEQLDAWIQMLGELHAACALKNRWPRSIFADGHATCRMLAEVTHQFFPRARLMYTPHNNLAIQWQSHAADLARFVLIKIARNMEEHRENYALVLSYRFMPSLVQPTMHTPLVSAWHNFLIEGTDVTYLTPDPALPVP